jgi:hypothetical protein
MDWGEEPGGRSGLCKVPLRADARKAIAKAGSENSAASTEVAVRSVAEAVSCSSERGRTAEKSKPRHALLAERTLCPLSSGVMP